MHGQIKYSGDSCYCFNWSNWLLQYNPGQACVFGLGLLFFLGFFYIKPGFFGFYTPHKKLCTVCVPGGRVQCLLFYCESTKDYRFSLICFAHIGYDSLILFNWLYSTFCIALTWIMAAEIAVALITSCELILISIHCIPFPILLPRHSLGKK